MTTVTMATRTVPHTYEDEVRYHKSMAHQMAERGYPGLTESHLIAAYDCPPGCDCAGCERGRREAVELIAARVARRRS